MVFPPVGRLTSDLLCNWLRPQIESGAELVVDRIPDVGRFIKLSMTAGPGLEMDNLVDNVGFQIMCRGVENSYNDAENIALEVDSILIGANENFDLQDVRVIALGRSGGAPQALPITDPESRFVFTCNYYVVVSTGL